MAERKQIAIITGASSGIGREFARQSDARYRIDEIWLIARRAERLRELAMELDAPARMLPFDLTDPASIDSLAGMLEKERPIVGMFINAAGVGVFGRTMDMTRADVDNMIALNVAATADLTHVILPYIPAGGRIILMSSIAAYMPIPGGNVYAATKAFVQSYAVALGHELKDDGITVTAVSPFWVDTEFLGIANPDGYIKNFMLMKKPEQVVKTALDDSERRRAVSVCGAAVKCLRSLMLCLPDKLLMSIWDKIK